MKASHSRNVTDVVFAVRAQSATRSQELLRQHGLGYTVSRRTQNSRQEIFYLSICLLIGYVGWRDEKRQSFSIPGEGNPDLRLRNGDHDHGPDSWQTVRRAEVEHSKTFPVEFLVKVTLPVASFDSLLQVIQVLDRYDAPG